MTNPPVGPRFRLAPGTVLRGGRGLPLPPAPAAPPQEPAPGQPPAGRPAPGFRNTRWDRSALSVSVDPSWLVAPLYVRDAARLEISDDVAPAAGQNLPGAVQPPVGAVAVTGVDLAAAAADWPTWWSAALAYRPGTPAPRAEDLFAGLAGLEHLWAVLAGPFRQWTALRSPRDPSADLPARAIERDALAGFAAAHGREPGRWTVRILSIPVTGGYLHSPEPRRIVVSAALRADPAQYAGALAAELPRHF